MTNKINGRTPEEIRNGLEFCSKLKTNCRECPYRPQDDGGCMNELLPAALALVNQLLEDKKQLERERDAAVADMTELMQLAQFCRYCKHLTEDGECTFDFAANKGEPWCWQWRGPEVE